MTESLLKIRKNGVELPLPRGSARGISQSLDAIDSGSLRRTVNGDLVSLNNPLFRKYRSTLSCSDMSSPAWAELWRGDVVEIECIQALREPASIARTRPAVPGSEFVENGVREYRPVLTFMVVGRSQERDEYAATESWSLELEEV